MAQEKKFQQKEERHLKVYEKYNSRSYHRYVVFPEIRLCGKWLQDIGFEHGQTIKVKQEKNKITITIDEENQTDG